jgi:hypothetical protein
MGWVWRVATGVEWDEAVPALRAYWQSHELYLRRLAKALGWIALAGVVLDLIPIPKIPNPEYLAQLHEWGSEAAFPRNPASLASTLLFAAFLVHCFYRLPLIASSPADLSRASMLPRRLGLLGLALLAGLVSGVILVFNFHSLFFLATGIALICVPVGVALGVQHRAPRLTRATLLVLYSWLVVTFIVDWVGWFPYISSYSTHHAWQTAPASFTLLLNWGVPALLLGLLCFPPTRLAGFMLSALGLLAITFFQQPLVHLLGPVYLVGLEHAGLVGLGRLDYTVGFWIR